MPSRYTLAAALRTTRAARGLSQERLGKAVEAVHLHNLEHGKSSATLETLEGICHAMDVDPVALLAVASSHERGESLEDYMAFLWAEISKIRDLGVLEGIPAQFDDGKLRTATSGKRPISAEKIRAVLQCKAAGLTQKETCNKLKMAASTVNKIWHSQKT